jgi:hypothetical protein
MWRASLRRILRGMPGAVRDRMTVEKTAWLVTSVAAISSGMIAGAQHTVTATSIITISAIIVVAVGILSRILPRHADHVP